MLVVDLDKSGNIRTGITISPTSRKDHTSITYDTKDNRTYVTFRSEVTYKMLELNPYDSPTALFLEVYRNYNDNIKFRLYSFSNEYAILYPTGDDPSLDEAVLINTVEYRMDPIKLDQTIAEANILTILTNGEKGQALNVVINFPTNTEVYLSFISSDSPTYNTGLYISFDNNKLTTRQEEQINDISDTVKDLVSESAAKFVSR